MHPEVRLKDSNQKSEVRLKEPNQKPEVRLKGECEAEVESYKATYKAGCEAEVESYKATYKATHEYIHICISMYICIYIHTHIIECIHRRLRSSGGWRIMYMHI